MIRDEAVARIQDGLGFAKRQEAKIIARLQEAQRDLEKGKTLPKFLLREGTTLEVLAGEREIVLPSNFLRIGQEPWYIDNVTKNVALMEVLPSYDYRDALDYYYSTESGAPSVAMLRRNSDGEQIMDLFHPMDRNYSIGWSYYRGAELLTSNIENLWLKYAPEWLIGEAGRRIAMDVRDKDAMTLFTEIRQAGRAAIFAEEIISEDVVGPVHMGSLL